MAGQRISFLDEVGQVSQLAKLHDEMDVCRCFLTVDQRHDVGMMEALQNLNLGVKVFFQLFVKLVHVDGFDGYVAGLLLPLAMTISKRILTREAVRVSVQCGIAPRRLRDRRIEGFKHSWNDAYGVCRFVDCSKASTSNLLQSPEAAD